MSVFLTKVFSLLIFPLSLGLVTVVCGLGALRFWRRGGVLLILLGVSIVWVPATPAFSIWVRGALEHLYPPQAVETVPTADAIVVLGGSVSPAIPPRIYPDLNSAADRVLHAARLYKAGKAPLVIVSSGALPWHKKGLPEAPAMRQLLTEWGVPQEAIVNETESQNTFENAVFTSRILDQHSIKTILLVTSALHMRRALAVFVSLGINAIPVATDYEIVDEGDRSFFVWIPDAEALSGSTRAIKEWVGYEVYQWQGRIQ